MRRLQIGVYVAAVLMFAGGLWLTEHRFDEALGRLCEQGNDGRDDLRRGIAVVLTENLIEAAEQTPDPQRVRRFREGLIDDLEREFPDHACS